MDIASLYDTLASILEDKKIINADKSGDDKIFRKDTKIEISNRDKQYTNLLSHFVKVTKWRNWLKEVFKWTFYIAIIVSIGVFVYMTNSLFDLYVKKAKIEQVIESLPLLITSIVGFVSVIITIPVTITKYLFSTKEDENITKLILHTQKHDTSGRKWASEVKELIKDTVKPDPDDSEPEEKIS